MKEHIVFCSYTHGFVYLYIPECTRSSVSASFYHCSQLCAAAAPQHPSSRNSRGCTALMNTYVYLETTAAVFLTPLFGGRAWFALPAFPGLRRFAFTPQSISAGPISVFLSISKFPLARLRSPHHPLHNRIASCHIPERSCSSLARNCP